MNVAEISKDLKFLFKRRKISWAVNDSELLLSRTRMECKENSSEIHTHQILICIFRYFLKKTGQKN